MLFFLIALLPFLVTNTYCYHCSYASLPLPPLHCHYHYYYHYYYFHSYHNYHSHHHPGCEHYKRKCRIVAPCCGKNKARCGQLI